MTREKWAKTQDDIPEQEHFVILEFSSIHVPGDERSRTNPGHGYPEHSEPKVDYIVFPDRDAWVAEIRRRTASRFNDNRSWTPIIARRATVTVDVSVGVSS